MTPQERTSQGMDPLSARAVLHEIRGDLYQYICSPTGRDYVKLRFYRNFSLLQPLTSLKIPTCRDHDEKEPTGDLCRLLTKYEELVYDALDEIEAGKEDEIIASLNDGSLAEIHKEIDVFLKAAVDSGFEGRTFGQDETLQAQATALFTIIELIGAVAVLFPGVFVSIGVPATLAKSIPMLTHINKVYPGVQMVLDKKDDIMILVGTMAAFAGGMQKSATQLLQQRAADENVQNITIIDETGKSISASELVQYALDLQNQTGNSEQVHGASESEEVPGAEPDQDIFKKITGLMDSIKKPVGESFKTVDQLAHQGITARMEDVSRGKEFVLQVPLTISDVGVRVGTDFSDKMRELSEKVGFIRGNDAPEDKEP